ncbi:MAG: rRNA maturation RNase YbeY [Puniceicoccales bacterium]
MTREIQIISRCNRLSLDETAIEDCLRKLDCDPRFAIPPGDLSIVFIGNEEMGDIHGTFLGDATPTDVITFPGDPEFGEAGEICVGVEQAEAVHDEHGVTLSHEILLYLAHGWLHLAGYDDKKEEDRLEMRRGEKEALAYLLADRDPPKFSLSD